MVKNFRFYEKADKKYKLNKDKNCAGLVASQLYCLAVLQSCSLAVLQSKIFLHLYNVKPNRAKMGTIKNFEELEIWKSARELVNLIYSDFRSCKDFVFKNQVTGAGTSIMNNISEGFCRNSDAEFRQFLNISKGSLGEIKNMYYIAEDQRYITDETASHRRIKCQGLLNGISSLMKYLKPSK